MQEILILKYCLLLPVLSVLSDVKFYASAHLQATITSFSPISKLYIISFDIGEAQMAHFEDFFAYAQYDPPADKEFAGEKV